MKPMTRTLDLDTPPPRTEKLGNHWGHAAVVASIASAALLPGTAEAEDLYLRVGIGLGRSAETQFTDEDCSSIFPAALYGCGTGGDGTPFRSIGNFSTAASLEFGLGYAVAPAVRLETLVEYWPRFTFDGRANFLDPERLQSVSADLSSLSGMLAAYVDLPKLGLRKFSPFIGGGIGAARVAIGETRMTFPKTTTIVPGTSRTGLTWMLTAGLGISLAEQTTLDLAWRYTDYGVIETGEGKGRVEWRDGSREPLALDLARTRAKLRSYGFRLSLRYAF